MTSSMLTMVLGAFFVGGAISFQQQKKPLWSVLLLAIIALALVGYGAYSWITSL
ncbi:hypothetical protein IEE91_09225 [Kocuria sp. cx-455]|uniref:hypothetical protein n=1 Tax=Kocuria sp. cx-455 TaxID=2771377 RepID=UPI001686E188|nr:hypothetical protein [Kocuria sp. cx-455]MBD2765362.1 hypothetical protein [Kocuria sp. cx-455]